MLTYTSQKWPETLKTTRTSTNTDRLGKSPVYEKQRVLKFRETVEPDGTCPSVRINRVSINLLNMDHIKQVNFRENIYQLFIFVRTNETARYIHVSVLSGCPESGVPLYLGHTFSSPWMDPAYIRALLCDWCLIWEVTLNSFLLNFSCSMMVYR